MNSLEKYGVFLQDRITRLYYYYFWTPSMKKRFSFFSLETMEVYSSEKQTLHEPEANLDEKEQLL